MKKYVIIAVVVLCVIVAIFNRDQKHPSKQNQPVKVVEKKASPPKTSARTIQRATPLKTSAKSVQKMSFPKHLISLEEVKKHPELHNENEIRAYWYRYNQSAAGYHHRKPEMANKNYRRSLSYKPVLGETRFNEIMDLADKDYPF